MPVPREPRLSLAAPLLGALLGAGLGLVTFVVVALMWRAGATRAAAARPTTRSSSPSSASP